MYDKIDPDEIIDTLRRIIDDLKAKKTALKTSDEKEFPNSPDA